MSPGGHVRRIIIIAKIAPAFLPFVPGWSSSPPRSSSVVFDVPFHGNVLVVLGGAALCVLSGIGIGTVIATFTHSAYQAQLTSFFCQTRCSPPLRERSLRRRRSPAGCNRWSGSTQIRRFSVIARSSMIKGSGFESALAELPGAFSLYAHHGVVERVARFRKTTQLKNDKTNPILRPVLILLDLLYLRLWPIRPAGGTGDRDRVQPLPLSGRTGVIGFWLSLSSRRGGRNHHQRQYDQSRHPCPGALRRERAEHGEKTVLRQIPRSRQQRSSRDSNTTLAR